MLQSILLPPLPKFTPPPYPALKMTRSLHLLPLHALWRIAQQFFQMTIDFYQESETTSLYFCYSGMEFRGFVDLQRCISLRLQKDAKIQEHWDDYFWKSKMLIPWILCIIPYISWLRGVCPIKLTILHTNDVHARIEEHDELGAPCPKKNGTNCYGGVARRYTAIKNIRRKSTNVLLLDAGDQFQGTLWFNIYRGKAARVFMNELKYNAMVYCVDLLLI